MRSMATSLSRVTLERNGRRQELQLDQVTVENIRRLFQTSPVDAWLRDDITDAAYFPLEDGTFDLSDGVTSTTTLVVEGSAVSHSSLPPPRSFRSQSVSSTPPISSSLSVTPSFRSVTAPRRPQSFSLKIVKATMVRSGGKRKPEFQSIGQTYIDLVESTANLEHVLNIVQNRWGAQFILVTSDGLQLEESSATQGLSFWRSPRRKLYAVLRSDCGCASKPVVLSDSEDDFQPRRKAKKQDREDAVLTGISDIKSSIAEMMSITESTRIPLGLYKIARDTFRCSICHIVPARPPIIVAKCCKTILGCEQCVNGWFSGPDALSKSCPSCRADRGYNETMLLRGLDDFIVGIKNLIQTSDERDDEELPSLTEH